MPITRARDNYTVRADGIRFLMRDGPLEVVCQIELETLLQVGNAMELSEAIEIFERNRAKIERAASHKYDRTSRQDYEIVTITLPDLALAPN